METVTWKEYLKPATSFILSAVTQPLVGAVGTAFVGPMDSPVHTGEVAIGTVIFNPPYWLFGFLRVATSGFAAKSLGKSRGEAFVHAWVRPFAIFLLFEWGLISRFGNHGLRVAFILLCAMRALVLLFSWNQILVLSFSSAEVGP